MTYLTNPYPNPTNPYRSLVGDLPLPQSEGCSSDCVSFRIENRVCKETLHFLLPKLRLGCLKLSVGQLDKEIWSLTGFGLKSIRTQKVARRIAQLVFPNGCDFRTVWFDVPYFLHR